MEFIDASRTDFGIHHDNYFFLSEYLYTRSSDEAHQHYHTIVIVRDLDGFLFFRQEREPRVPEMFPWASCWLAVSCKSLALGPRSLQERSTVWRFAGGDHGVSLPSGKSLSTVLRYCVRSLHYSGVPCLFGRRRPHLRVQNVPLVLPAERSPSSNPH